jgi:uncharacterized protein with FMN-binding domain
MAKKMGKRLMGICGVAVTAVYAAGYIYTMPSAQATASSTLLPAASASAPASSSASTTDTAKHTAKQHPTSSKKNQTASTAKYKDGTYTGTGTNSYGTCSVAVTIHHGKIISVKITNYMMHYPQYYIDPQLPKEVVSMQTWKIYVISGATASTYNFAEAVYYALQKAKA